MDRRATLLGALALPLLGAAACRTVDAEQTTTLNAVVETVVEEQRIIRILETVLHISRRDRSSLPTVTGLTRPAVATERLLPKQASALIVFAR